MLRKYIQKIIAAFKQKATEAIHETDAAYEHSDEVANVLRAETQIIQTAIETYRTNQEQSQKLEKRRFIVEKITLVAVFVYATITMLQWLAMTEAVRTAKEANQITELTAARANTRILEANKIARDAVDKSDKNAAETMRINDETLILNREGLELSRRSLIASQRAWLIPKDMFVTFKDRTFSIKLQVSNTGRNPATALRGYLQIFREGEPEIFLKAGEQTIFPYTFIAPGNDHELEFIITLNPNVSEQFANAIRDGKIKSRFKGALLYSDDYSRDRTLSLCGLYRPNQSGYAACPEYEKKTN